MDAVLDPSSVEHTGVPVGDELLAFADAVERGNNLDEARSNLVEAVGTDGMLEAAATVAAFNGLIRVADGTGIQLDDGVKEASADARSRLGINRYAGAASTPDAEAEPSAPPRPMGVRDLFS